MPYQDGTGPFGDGRMGRGLGPCGRGRAFGPRCGFGQRAAMRGRGLGRMAFKAYEDQVYPYTKEELEAHKADLEKQLKWLEEEIKKN